jgi:hypothetical protein
MFRDVNLILRFGPAKTNVSDLLKFALPSIWKALNINKVAIRGKDFRQDTKKRTISRNF